MGFCLGSVLGFLGGSIKGAWHSPRQEKFYGAIRLGAKRSPGFGCSFALWIGIFAMGQCGLEYLTEKDTRLNQTISGGLAGGLVNCRGGFAFFCRGAFSGAVILGLMGLGEEAMMKYQLKQKCEANDLVETYRNDMQMRQLKKQNPQIFDKYKTLSREEMHQLKKEIEALTGERIPDFEEF